MDDTVCTVCGHKIEGSGAQKTGRPAQFHKPCRELNNALSLLQSRLGTYKVLNPSKEKKNMIRKALWSIANGLN